MVVGGAVASVADEYRGPVGIRHTICEHFRLWLPQHAVVCRDAWGLDEARLPLPVSEPTDRRADAYFAREPTAIDRWPLLAVTTGPYTQTEHDFEEDGSPVSRGTYPVRVYSWIKTEGYDEAQDVRDNFAALVAVTARSHVNLGDPSLQLVPSTVRMDFSAVAQVKGDRFVAGSFVGFTVIATETLSDRLALPGGAPRDTVDLVTATGTVLPTPTAP